MENSVVSAIEKIKQQEHTKEAKLKEKRELEATKGAIKRSIRDVTSQAKKLQAECADLVKHTDRLRSELPIQKMRRDALSAQLEASTAELKHLKCKCDHGYSEIQELRSSYCQEVQGLSDEYDVWALLVKPGSTEPLPRQNKKSSENIRQESHYEDRLENAKARHSKVTADRDGLLAEPDVGEKFVRRYFNFNINRFLSSKVEASENEPIKFSTSPAARLTVKPVIRRVKIDMPWYQPYSVTGSVAVFLIYFCIFREENDVDLEFTKTLYERVKGLEKEQLLLAYKFNKENGKSVADIEKRLEEIAAQETEHVA